MLPAAQWYGRVCIRAVPEAIYNHPLPNPGSAPKTLHIELDTAVARPELNCDRERLLAAADIDTKHWSRITS